MRLNDIKNYVWLKYMKSIRYLKRRLTETVALLLPRGFKILRRSSEITTHESTFNEDLLWDYNVKRRDRHF